MKIGHDKATECTSLLWHVVIWLNWQTSLAALNKNKPRTKTFQVRLTCLDTQRTFTAAKAYGSFHFNFPELEWQNAFESLITFLLILICIGVPDDVAAGAGGNLP